MDVGEEGLRVPGLATVIGRGPVILTAVVLLLAGLRRGLQPLGDPFLVLGLELRQAPFLLFGNLVLRRPPRVPRHLELVHVLGLRQIVIELREDLVERVAIDGLLALLLSRRRRRRRGFLTAALLRRRHRRLRRLLTAIPRAEKAATMA